MLEPKRGFSKPSFSSREAGLGSHPSRERERRLTKTPSGVFSKPQSEGIDTQSLSALGEQSFQKATNMPASYDRPVSDTVREGREGGPRGWFMKMPCGGRGGAEEGFGDRRNDFTKINVQKQMDL